MQPSSLAVPVVRLRSVSHLFEILIVNAVSGEASLLSCQPVVTLMFQVGALHFYAGKLQSTPQLSHSVVTLMSCQHCLSLGDSGKQLLESLSTSLRVGA